MRILWSSNAPWAKTGYGNQTALFTPRLKAAGHELGIFAWYGCEGGTLNWAGMPVYPKALNGYGVDVLGAHSAHFRADITITLIDAWVMDPDLWARTATGMRWVPWFPIDMDPPPPSIVGKVAQSFQPIVYSRHARRECQRAGLDVRYVPHGIDLQAFRPMDRKAAREKLGWPDDRFVALMVAANKGTPSRKAFPEVLEAFAEFARRRGDAHLHLHTYAGPEMAGVDLRGLVEALALEKRVTFSDQYAMLIGLNDEYMRALYSAADVLLSPSLGEGFGIPILEAQACGCPVITGDWTSMSEITFKGLALPKANAHRIYTPLKAWQYMPAQSDIAHALATVYDAPYSREVPAAVAGYEAEAVVRNHWLPVLAEIEHRLPEKAAA